MPNAAPTSPEAPSKIFPSKRDTWLVLVLWLGVAGMIAGAVSVWRSPGSLLFHFGVSAALLASAAFILWVLYSTDYQFTAEKLRIRSGPFSWTVEVNSIEEVFPTRNPLSSPACSLDRLRIRYRGSRFGIMISPEDKAGFLEELAARNPQFQTEDSRLVRRPE